MKYRSAAPANSIQYESDMAIDKKVNKETGSLSLKVNEEPATFQEGDINKFKKYVLSKFKYPESLKGTKVSGRLLVQFVIDANGKVTEIKILRSVHADIDKEIIQILKNSPLWAPGKQNGNAVKQQFVMPLEIKP
jgi:protein TonB